ncbi:MAG: tRNA (adenosine(37)-N6)-dimethylallyltransferase MiaA, partial [Pedobacter sp.]
MSKYPLVVILGPTASGKTELAVKIAGMLNGAVISGDSRQVFKRMDIGTGKDLNAYVYNGKPVPYYLIDILDPGQKYNVHSFKKDFFKIFSETTELGYLPVLCGGSGMYIHNILTEYAYTGVPANELLRDKLAHADKAELLEKLTTLNSPHTAHADLSSSKRM